MAIPKVCVNPPCLGCEVRNRVRLPPLLGEHGQRFAAAFDLGYEMLRYGLLGRISATLEHYLRGAGEARAVGGAAS